MADVIRTGPVSGKQYAYRAKGDTLTADEQREFDALVRQREAAFGKQYAEQFGAAPAGIEGDSLLDYPGELFKGVGRGVGNFAETAGLGLAALLPENLETPTREGIKKVSRWAQSGIQPDIGFEGRKGAEIVGRLGEGLGSFGALAATAFVPGGAFLAPGLATASGTGEASERARAAGATLEQRNTAAMLGAPVGLSEMIPLKVLERTLGGEFTGQLLSRIRRIFAQGGIEGAQEAAAEAAQNMIQQRVYDPERGVFTDTGEAFGYGAGVGAIVQGLLDLALPRSRGGSVAPPQEEQQLELPLPPASRPYFPEGEAQGELFGPMNPRSTPGAEVPSPAGITGLLPPPSGARPRPNTGPSSDQMTEQGDLGLPVPTRPYFPEGEEQGDLFGPMTPRTEAEADVETPAAETPTPAPAVKKADPVTRAEMERILDDLGVPKTAAVYRAASSGAIPDVATLDARLAKFASATSTKNETRTAQGRVRARLQNAPEARTVEKEADLEPDAAPAAADVAAPVDAGGTGGQPESVGGQPEQRPATPESPAAPDAPAPASVGAGLADIQPAAVAEVTQPPAVETPAATPELVVPAVTETVDAPRAPDAATQPTPAAPPAAASAPYNPMSGAIPGVQTGAAGQVIPPPVSVPTPPAPAPVPGVPLGQATVDTIRAERDAVRNQQTDAQLTSDIVERFNDIAPAPLKRAWNEIKSLISDSIKATVRDKAAVLDLLRKAVPKRVGKTITPERAAAVYFSKAPDIGYVLDMIAYDAAQAEAPKRDRDVPDFRNKSYIAAEAAEGMEGEADATRKRYEEQNLAMFEGTGAVVAQRAAQWVRDNMSPETAAAMDRRIARDYRVTSRDVDAATSKAMDRRIEGERFAQDWMNEQLEPGAKPFSRAAPEVQSGGRVHPRVEQLLKAGNLSGALHALSLTARSPQERKLAQKLQARVKDVPSKIITRQEMADIQTALDPETNRADAELTPGLYIWPATPEKQAAFRRANQNGIADAAEQYGDTVLFTDTAWLTPELVLHEAVHAASQRTLSNKSHPFTRQMERMRTEMLKFMPATTYGLTDVHEMMSEGMANPTFRRDLSYANLEGQPFSAWQRFKNVVGNFLRSMIGRPPKKMDSAKDQLDRYLDSIISTDPDEAGGGEYIASSFSRSAPQLLKKATDRVRVPTKADMEQFGTVMKARGIPAEWKGTLARLAMPLDYLADSAAKYIPSARLVHDLVMQHQAEIQRAASRVSQTTEQIAAVLGKYKNQQDLIDAFNKVRLTGSQLQVDVRKPRSHYEGYSFRYNLLDADGNIVDSKTSQRFKDESARNAALQAYNATLPDGAPQAARARKAFNEDAEVLADYDRLKPIYAKMPEDMRTALDTTFALPVAVNKDLAEAIKDKIAALVPNSATLQNKIYGVIYQKIMAGQIIDPYQALRREGQFWLAYSAVDPETGRIEQFKHSFHTSQQRDFAVARLQALGDEAKVTGITPYENVGSARARPTVPLEFVAKVLDSIDGAEVLNQDDKGKAIKAQIIELMFDTAPETSFINAYRKRQGTAGFDGDVTPITDTFAAGDTIKNIRESNLRIARQVADLKYGAKFAAVRTAMEGEYNTFAQNPPTDKDPLQHAQDVVAARTAHDALRDYTFVPFKQRGALSRNLTGGAYMLTLGFNLSTAMITMSQLPLFVAPFLAGKHGIRQTIASIGAAHRMLAASGRERTVERIAPDGTIETVRAPVHFYDFSLDNYDYDDPNSPGAYLKELHRVAKNNGVFNRSLMQDELLGEQPTTFQRIAAASGVVQHHAERYSREVALGAAYHLELKAQMGAQNSIKDFIAGLQDGSIKPTASQAKAAAEAAVNTSEKTNGPIYAAAGPLASQSDFGAVVYLFKRHPLAMMNLIFQTARRSFGSDVEDRKIAQRQGALLFASFASMAGALGMPLMQQVGWLYDMFADDDEPDFETVVRTMIGEQGAHGLVDYMTGLRISERIGLSGAFYRPGFAADRLPVPYQIIEGMGGPVVGLGLKYLDRAPKLFAEGEFQRGFESIAPTAVANFMRSYRFGSEGVNTMRGDPIVNDIGPFSLGAQALGFMPAQYSQQLAQNAAVARIDNAINTKKSRLLQKRYIALRNGDWDTVRDIDRDIQEFNQRHPRNPISADTVKRSMTSHERTTARTHHGMSVSAGNEAYIKELTDDWGYSSIWQ